MESLTFDGLRRQNGPVRILSSRRRIADQAQDIVQTALLRCWRSRSKIRNEVCFGSYIRTTARNVAVDFSRRSARYVQFPEDYDVAGPSTISLDAIDVRRALDRIPPKSRRMLELFYFDGLSCGEVGRQFGNMSTEAVYGALARARRQCRLQLLARSKLRSA
jgi:RNA polymerase sigma factor (sigma-70 family)